MEKVKSCLYWLAVLVSYLAAFTLFGMILVFLLGLPKDSMFSGFAAWSLILCGFLFTDDELRETLKKLIQRENDYNIY